MSSRPEKHLWCLLKGCLSNRTNIVIIDAMTEYRHHLTVTRHTVAEEANVMVIDVCAVELNDF